MPVIVFNGLTPKQTTDKLESAISTDPEMVGVMVSLVSKIRDAYESSAVPVVGTARHVEIAEFVMVHVQAAATRGALLYSRIMFPKTDVPESRRDSANTQTGE